MFKWALLRLPNSSSSSFSCYLSFIRLNLATFIIQTTTFGWIQLFPSGNFECAGRGSSEMEETVCTEVGAAVLCSWSEVQFGSYSIVCQWFLALVCLVFLV